MDRPIGEKMDECDSVAEKGPLSLFLKKHRLLLPLKKKTKNTYACGAGFVFGVENR
jgi:hypothetical protein